MATKFFVELIRESQRRLTVPIGVKGGVVQFRMPNVQRDVLVELIRGDGSMKTLLKLAVSSFDMHYSEIDETIRRDKNYIYVGEYRVCRMTLVCEKNESGARGKRLGVAKTFGMYFEECTFEDDRGKKKWLKHEPCIKSVGGVMYCADRSGAVYRVTRDTEVSEAVVESLGRKLPMTAIATILKLADEPVDAARAALGKDCSKTEAQVRAEKDEEINRLQKEMRYTAMEVNEAVRQEKSMVERLEWSVQEQEQNIAMWMLQIQSAQKQLVKDRKQLKRARESEPERVERAEKAVRAYKRRRKEVSRQIKELRQ